MKAKEITLSADALEELAAHMHKIVPQMGPETGRSLDLFVRLLNSELNDYYLYTDDSEGAYFRFRWKIIYPDRGKEEVTK